MALGALFLGGCLLPQEDDVLEPIVLRNRPPRIVEQGMEPGTQEISIGPTCVQEFSAYVEDPDVNDLLTYRFYVDYDLGDIPFEEEVLPNRGSARRQDKARVVVNLDSTTTELGQVGTHLVTLMVFDGDLLLREGPGTDPDPDPVPGLDGGNPRFSTTHTWAVNVDPLYSCTSVTAP